MIKQTTLKATEADLFGDTQVYSDGDVDPFGASKTQPLGVVDDDLLRDKDGVAIPSLWHGNPSKWEKLALPVRVKQAQAYIDDLARKAGKPVKREAQIQRGENFTTQYCVDWGRKQGWRLAAREIYNFRTRRHHDLELGGDAKFETDTDWVMIQGAGKGERTKHRARFEERGGIERARKMNMRFLYVEFLRESKEPILLEWWA